MSRAVSQGRGRWAGGGRVGPAVRLAAGAVATQGIGWLGWCVLGAGVLAGRLDGTSVAAWALLTLSLPAARAVEVAAGWELGGRGAVAMRRRVLERVLHAGGGSDVEGAGASGWFGRLLAAEAWESGWSEGAVAVCLAAAELGGAAIALSHGLATRAEVGLLVGAAGVAAAVALRAAPAEKAVRRSEGELTGRLVEALAGQRTLRLEGWGNLGGDTTVRGDGEGWRAAHAMAVRRLGRFGAALRQGIPGGWMVAGLAALGFGLGGRPPSTGAMALSLGGLLAGRDGLARLGTGLGRLGSAWAARLWATPCIGPLSVQGGAAVGLAGRAGGARHGARGAAPRAVGDLEARDVVCRAGPGGRQVLRGACLVVRPGDRIVVSGPPGAGKSTLAAVLAGLRGTDGGAVLLGGYDVASLGAEAWRRRVVAVLQMDRNRIFRGSLGWNLLLGRGWPPGAEDKAAAEAMCQELGLGELLARMPGGLEEPIGEGGWRVSDGEAARICVGRALLQEPEVLVLDESLAALDPASRLRVLAVIERRARSVVLIAHAAGG